MGEAGKIVGQEARQRPDGGGDAFGCFAGAETEFVEQRLEARPATAKRADEGAQAVALVHDLGKQRVETGFAAALQHGGEGLCQSGLAGGVPEIMSRRAAGEQRRLHLRVEHFEMRGDVGFQRKLVQHRFAEGVDGLDLQPARRFQRLGEQPPCPAQRVAIGPTAVQSFDPCPPAPSSPSAVHSDKRRKHPVRHVGGGGARVGQAQDLRRIGAAQQQSDDALRQHMGLARAGIGRHPGRIPRDRKRAPGWRRCRSGSGRPSSCLPRLVVAVAASRPFEHARQMVVVAVRLALAEGQRARQIARRRVGIVEQQLFQPRPGLLGEIRRRSSVLRLYSRINSSNTSPFGFSLTKASCEGSRTSSVLKAPRRSSAPSSASCGASSVCACAFDGDEPVL